MKTLSITKIVWENNSTQGPEKMLLVPVDMLLAAWNGVNIVAIYLNAVH